jgi:hypothetical protein
MPVAGGGFEQCYNAQAVVAAGSLLVVAAGVVQAANDKQQVEARIMTAIGDKKVNRWHRCSPTSTSTMSLISGRRAGDGARPRATWSSCAMPMTP